jgi:hypothetical protein
MKQVVDTLHCGVAGLARRAAQREIDRNTEDVGHGPVMAPGPHLRIASVAGIGQQPGEGDTGGDGLLQHGDGQLRLGGEADLVGDAGRPAPLPVLGPLLGQIEAAVQEDVSGGSGVGEHDRGLAVAHVPGQAAVLEGHPDRLDALLLSLGVVDDQRRLRIAEVFHEVVADRVPQSAGHHTEPLSSHYMRSAVACPARSDSVQPFFFGSSASSPSTNCANTTRGSGRLNRCPNEPASLVSSSRHSAISSAVTSRIMPGQRRARDLVTRSPAVVLAAAASRE